MSSTDWADKAVAKGIKFLVAHGVTDWKDRIDWDLLDIFDPRICIAGQAFADKVEGDLYTSGYHYAFEVIVENGGRVPAYGFAAGYVEKDVEDSWVMIGDLNAAWRRAAALL